MSYRWKLWYEDGGTFSDCEGRVWESPPFGVVFVTQPGINSRDLLWGHDFLLYRSDLEHWTGHDLIGLVDQLVHFAQYVVCVRPGREMDTDLLKAMIHEAVVEMRGK